MPSAEECNDAAIDNPVLRGEPREGQASGVRSRQILEWTVITALE